MEINSDAHDSLFLRYFAMQFYHHYDSQLMKPHTHNIHTIYTVFHSLVATGRWSFCILIMLQSYVLLLWQQQWCQLSSHYVQDALWGNFSFGHTKCQLKLIPVSMTAWLSLPWQQKHWISLLWCVCVWLYTTTASETINWLTLEP